MPKKKKSKKVKDLAQTDGMSRGEEEKYVPTTLDQVFGDEGTDKYKTLDFDVYEN